MTTPTPDGTNFARASRMLRADLDRGDWEHGANWARDMRMILDAADALAAVTAERDVVMLLAHRYANQATNAETERDQACQMLADAPHETSCASLWRYPDHHVEACDCWKAGL